MDMVSLSIDAEGEVEEHLDRTSWFKTVTLYPKIVVTGKPKEMVQRALDMALKYSTICQSFKFEVIIKPDIVIQ